jgi:hypothetical protein
MNKVIVIVIIGLAGAAAAQTPGAPEVPAEIPAQPPTQAPAQPPQADAAEARKQCTAAMNADPEFARSIVATADKGIDQRTIDAHNMAAAQIAENERHVIYAYAAMWILAALFVGFLWYRQQMLKAELAALRRELDAAAKEPK